MILRDMLLHTVEHEQIRLIKYEAKGFSYVNGGSQMSLSG
jgi:hypothetical protein